SSYVLSHSTRGVKQGDHLSPALFIHEVIKKILSYGGKVVLIKNVLQSLHIYLLSSITPPKCVIHELHILFARFFWSSYEGERHKHWVAWTNMCFPREEGGLGFKSLFGVSKALFVKLWWSFRTKKSILMKKILPLGEVLIRIKNFITLVGVQIPGFQLKVFLHNWWKLDAPPKLKSILMALPPFIIWQLWKRRNALKHGEKMSFIRLWKKLIGRFGS
ncbi:hypothetical protein H5410_040427, partial [Solanum commersonii]